MDIRQILDDPTAAITARWDSDASQAVAVRALVDTIEQLKPLLKAAQQKKQTCARQFSGAKRDGTPLEPLLAHMREISNEISAIEDKQKQARQQLLELFETTESSTPQLPLRFQQGRDQPCGTTTIFEADALHAEAWDLYVADHPQASAYHRYLWRDIIKRSFQQQSIYLAARDDSGRLRGVLPIIRLRSILFGDFNVSMPYFNYGGVLADNPAVTAQLLNHASVLTRTNGQRHLEVRATTRLNEWPARIDKVSMIRGLPKSIEALEDELGSKLRAQINRARREQPTIHRGGIDLLDDFYSVFARNMRDLGTPVYSRRFFANILLALPANAHLLVLRLQGQPVAAAFLLGDRDLMEIPWASTLRSVNGLSMNMLLYREVLRLAIDLNYPFFDFGRSTVDAGTYHFKRQWGAQPLQHYWHYALPDGEMLPELKPDSPKFRLLVRCWQQLPIAIANLIGPLIVRNLP